MIDRAEAYRQCIALTKSHYENFPVASALVPKSLRPSVAAVYAFARTADDFADEGRHGDESPSSLQERLQKLDSWEHDLEACVNPSAMGDNGQHPYFIALADTIQRHNLTLQPFRDLLNAYRMDVRQSRYKKFEDVIFYCRHSANPVGRLLLALFGQASTENIRYSDAICTALQLANFWQDVGIDAQMDRIYIPEEDMKKFGVTETEILNQQSSDRFSHLLQFQVVRTWSLFNEGQPLIRRLAGRFGWEIRMTWLGGDDDLAET